MVDQNVDINSLIQNQVEKISNNVGKEFLDCEDIIKLTGLGRDNVRKLLRRDDFPITQVGRRKIVSILNFVLYILKHNKDLEEYSVE